MSRVFIMSASQGFLPGVYAILEAMERYGHTEDVHILYYGDTMHEDLERVWVQNYSFKIFLQPLSAMRENYPVEVNEKVQRGWDCRFYNYRYALDLNYDTYAIWNADALLLNNIGQYFDIAEKFIVLSNNYHHIRSKTTEPIISPMNNPICDVPFITSDKEILAGIWEMGQGEPMVTQGRNDMFCIFNTIAGQGKAGKIFLVSYDHWVYPCRLEQRQVLSDKNGGYYFRDSSRINCLHGPFWKESFVYRDQHDEFQRKVYGMFYEIYQAAADKYGLEL